MIVFDLQATQSLGSGHRGIGRYTRDLAAALVRRHPDLIDAWAWNANEQVDPRIFDVVPRDRLVSTDELAGRHVDVFHIASPFEHQPIDRLLPTTMSTALVATCFDLIPLRFQDQYLIPLARSEYLTRAALLHRCRAIVTDSASAASDCVDMLGIPADRLTVIGGGTNECFVLPTDSLDERVAVLNQSLPALRPGFIMLPTGMDWRKNIDGAVEAYGRLPVELQDDHQLVVACKVTHHERRYVERLASEAGVVGDVVVTGYTSDDDLVRLYQSADVVLFPSRYEGFGLPVLEARRCGARVICSNVSSLPEVMPLEAATFNPWAVDEIAATLERSLTDDAFRTELDAAPDPGFTFDRAADLTADVYRRVVAECHRQRARRTPRIAVVTLLPPTPSGVADHSVALLDELRRIADVTCFVANDMAAAEATARPYPVRRLDLLPTLALGGAFDAVLYTMGNNRFHRPFVDMLERVPGAVLFHDTYVGGCFTPVERQQIADEYDEDGASPLYAASIAERALACLVQSEHAGQMLAADTGVEPIMVGPHPMVPLAWFPGDPEPGRSGTDVHIASLGIADIRKQTDVFVSAAEQVLARHPDWKATVVGLGGTRFVTADSPVSAVGEVDDDEFEAWLDRATVLVQLRDGSNGESSGVVAKALARGVPLVATEIGAVGELPDDVLVKVDRAISASELAEVIERLVLDQGMRSKRAEAGRRYAGEHTYRHQASAVLAAVLEAAAGVNVAR